MRVLLLILCCCLPLLAQTAIEGQVLHADSIALRGLLITDATCIPQMQGQALRLLGIEASCYRGRLLGEAVYRRDSGDVLLELHLRNMYLQDLVHALGSDAELDGLIDADLSVSIPAGNWQAARGQASLRLRHGSILSLPGLADMLLEGEGHRGLDRGEAQMLIGEGQIVFDRLLLENPAVRVKGHGRIGLDGALDLEMNPMAKAGLLRRTPLIGWLMANAIRELTRGAIKVQIGGHITAPTFRTRF